MSQRDKVSGGLGGEIMVGLWKEFCFLYISMVESVPGCKVCQ